MVERLQQRLAEDNVPQVKTVVVDGQALDLPDGSMDFVTSNFGVIFFPDVDRGFREMHRVLKPGGAAAITSWGPREKLGLQQVIGEAIKRLAIERPKQGSPGTTDLSDPAVVSSRLGAAGFSDVQITTRTEPWILETPRTIEQLITSNPGAKPFLAALTDQQRLDLIETLVTILEERSNGGEVSMDMEAHIAIARKG